MSLPFMKFFPADWVQDTQTISLQTEGAWIRIICAMWIAKARGMLTLKKRHLNVLLTNIPDKELENICIELRNVADTEWRDASGNKTDVWENVNEVTIINRRMVRENQLRERGLEYDRRYRNKNQQRPTNELQTSSKRREDEHETSKRSQKSDI